MLEKLGNGIRAHDNLLRKLAQVGIAFPSAARDSPRPMWFVPVDDDQIAENLAYVNVRCIAIKICCL